MSDEPKIWIFYRSSRVIRFYLWLYEADADRISFCKLFWALLLAPVALTARVIWRIVRPGAKAFFNETRLERIGDRAGEWMATHEPPKRVGQVLCLVFALGFFILGFFSASFFVSAAFMLFWAWFANGSDPPIKHAFGWLGTRSWRLRRVRRFFSFFGAGYHAVKTRSCPRIVVFDMPAREDQHAHQ